MVRFRFQFLLLFYFMYSSMESPMTQSLVILKSDLPPQKKHFYRESQLFPADDRVDQQRFNRLQDDSKSSHTTTSRQLSSFGLSDSKYQPLLREQNPPRKFQRPQRRHFMRINGDQEIKDQRRRVLSILICDTDIGVIDQLRILLTRVEGLHLFTVYGGAIAFCNDQAIQHNFAKFYHQLNQSGDITTVYISAFMNSSFTYKTEQQELDIIDRQLATNNYLDSLQKSQGALQQIVDPQISIRKILINPKGVTQFI